jgi:hypothetical protein
MYYPQVEFPICANRSLIAANLYGVFGLERYNFLVWLGAYAGLFYGAGMRES